ncbi:MAG: deoxynucleoside kinase [Clostridium sp.]|nr:deoxynucleoside kinase [Clostridium sp.]MCM1398268.1 deoxynucleoside kinase [Clostridium sp.]MCM1459068.1 deoxynucleoside kinase [Bacteroides sp.]
MLAAIIGIDGSGKTTQIEMLKKSVSRTVHVCKAIPANRSIVEGLCFDDFVTYKEALSFAMALDLTSAYHKQMIMDDAAINIWDRYKYCNQAYFLADGISYEKTNIILNQLKTPELTIWLKLDPAIAAKRVQDRGDAKPGENEPFLSLAHKCYENVLQDVDNVFPLECTGRLAGEIHEEIVSIMNRYL